MHTGVTLLCNEHRDRDELVTQAVVSKYGDSDPSVRDVCLKEIEGLKRERQSLCCEVKREL